MLEHVRDSYLRVHGGIGGMDTYPGDGSRALNSRGGGDVGLGPIFMAD